MEMSMKAKGQHTKTNAELLALALTFGGLADRSNATECKSANGVISTVLGFEIPYPPRD
jgi:hypothetical protein